VKIYLNSDLLAVGIDTKGRKQYVYSEEFKKKREKKKYCQLITLSGKIERLKTQINRDLKQDNYNLSKLIALVLKIMDLCNFRSGQRKMEKKYKSHGITTVHKNHLAIANNNQLFPQYRLHQKTGADQRSAYLQKALDSPRIHSRVARLHRRQKHSYFILISNKITKFFLAKKIDYSKKRCININKKGQG
jgi:DNA topoisomerase IB